LKVHDLSYGDIMERKKKEAAALCSLVSIWWILALRNLGLTVSVCQVSRVTTANLHDRDA